MITLACKTACVSKCLYLAWKYESPAQRSRQLDQLFMLPSFPFSATLIIPPSHPEVSYPHLHAEPLSMQIAVSSYCSPTGGPLCVGVCVCVCKCNWLYRYHHNGMVLFFVFCFFGMGVCGGFRSCACMRHGYLTCLCQHLFYSLCVRKS